MTWEIWDLQKRLKFHKSFLLLELQHQKASFFSCLHGGKKLRVFSLFSLWNKVLQRWSIWMRIQLWFLTEQFYIFNRNQTSKEQDLNFTKSSYFYFGSSRRKMFWKSCQACNFPLHSFLNILVAFFWPVLKKITKILKVGKIFPYVTLFYQYFFASDKICYHQTNSGTRITAIKNLLTMISMRYMWQHFRTKLISK